MIKQEKKWVVDVPNEVWLRFEDLGYFLKDINLIGAVIMSKMILKRLEALEEDDFYTELHKDYPDEYAKVLASCKNFLNSYSQHVSETSNANLGEVTVEENSLT